MIDNKDVFLPARGGPFSASSPWSPAASSSARPGGSGWPALPPSVAAPRRQSDELSTYELSIYELQYTSYVNMRDGWKVKLWVMKGGDEIDK